MKKVFSFVEIILYIFFLSILWFFTAIMLRQFLWLWNYLVEVNNFKIDFNKLIITLQNLSNQWYRFYQSYWWKLILSGNGELVYFYCDSWLFLSGDTNKIVFSNIDCVDILWKQYLSWYWFILYYKLLWEEKNLKLWYK